MISLPVTGKGNVINQRVEPDVGDEVRVKGEFNSPVETLLGAGDAEVSLARSINGVENLGSSEFRKNSKGSIGDCFLEPGSVVGKSEVPVFLRKFDDLSPFLAKGPIFTAVLFG